MNPLELFNFLKELLQKDAEVIAGFVVGVVITVIVLWILRRWLPLPKQMAELKARLAKVRDELESAQITITTLNRLLGERYQQQQVLHQKAQEMTEELSHLRDEMKEDRSRSEAEKSRLAIEGHELRSQLQECQAAQGTTIRMLRAEETKHLQNIRTANERFRLLNSQLRTLNDQVMAQHKKLQALSQECERLKDENNNLTGDLEDARSQAKETKQQLNEASMVASGFEQELNAMIEQIRQLDNLQGKIWERHIGPSVPPFRSLDKGAAPILAVANLKGGVGKTSIAANLAATFAGQGKRVLVVDLDHQSSLTQLCMDLENLRELKHAGGRFVQDVLKAKSEHAAFAWRNTAGIPNVRGGSIRILATDECLVDAEEHLKAHWLLNPDSIDVRFILRAALHDLQIQKRFDLVLLDCPPRLSTACINALTCCDFVLIPVILDRVSTEAVPRLLAWLYHLKNKQRLCPDLSVLGVVANRTQQRPRLTTKETGVWEELKAKNRESWHGEVHHFARFIPSSQHIADAAGKAEFAAYDPHIGDLFDELAEQVERRLNSHESRCSTATVS